jgi:preprotein translocase subunit SecF
VLPVLSLMVVAVWLLGVGTLKDLALVQLVGIMVGTYSSIFFATPLLVTLRERTELVRIHNRRVLRRRDPVAGKAPDKPVKPVKIGKPVKGQERPQERPRERPEPADDEEFPTPSRASFAATGDAAPSTPVPDAGRARHSAGRHARPSGKRNKR